MTNVIGTRCHIHLIITLHEVETATVIRENSSASVAIIIFFRLQQGRIIHEAGEAEASGPGPR